MYKTKTPGITGTSKGAKPVKPVLLYMLKNASENIIMVT